MTEVTAIPLESSDLPGDRHGVRGSNPGIVPPIPAPRLSKQKNFSPSTCDILDEEGCNVSDSYSNSSDLLPKGFDKNNFKSND